MNLSPRIGDTLDRYRPGQRQLSQMQATEQGYRALTVGYQLPAEQPMLDAVLADMQRGQIEHCTVHTSDGVEVWRKGLITATDQKHLLVRTDALLSIDLG